MTLQTVTVLLIFTLALLAGCGDLAPLPKTVTPQETVPGYTKDGSAGLLTKYKWYSYDPDTHLIWPHYDVYLFKVGKEIFKFQILGYYAKNDTTKSGHYTVRTGPLNSPGQIVHFDASGCVNPQANPDYKNCMKDPNKNVFTYLNLQTLTTSKITDAESQLSNSWHLAFKGTHIRINGISGSGRTQGALAYRDQTIAPANGPTNLDRIQKVIDTKEYEKFYEIKVEPSKAHFFPISGRAIAEQDWHKSAGRSHFKVALSDNWWIIESKDKNTHTRFNVSDITEVEGLKSDGSPDIITSLSIKYAVEKKNEKSFPTVNQIWRIEDIHTFKRRQTICFDFDTASIKKCLKSSDIWDVKFVFEYKKVGATKQRIWIINVNGAAYGPLSSDVVHSIISGKITP